jgi:formylmethanofuran dehydrogenase subunit B
MQNLLSSSLLLKNIKIKITLPVLYGCETSSVTLKEKCRLRVFENRMWKRMFGSKRNVVTADWRRVHNKELNDLYFKLNVFG